jgi:hypothetical protein
MSPDLALQKALRSRLAADAAVTSLVPASSILDRHARPAPDPAIIIGEGQWLPGDDIGRDSQRVVLDLHVWKREPGLAGAKAIAGAILANLRAFPRGAADAFHVGDCRVSMMRYLRDPDGETSHAVVTVEALMSEAA